MTEKHPTDVGLRTERSGIHGAELIKAIGYVDLSTANILESAVAEVLEQEPDALVIDLTGVDFLGSGGLAILARTHSALAPRGKFAVVANDIIARSLEITGLDRQFTVRRTLDDVFSG